MAEDAHNHDQHVTSNESDPDLELAVFTQAKTNDLLQDTCVICLDIISEKAIALPCRHEQFDFPCLGTWLQQSQVCPLCKAEVKAIKHDAAQEGSGGDIFYLPARDIPRKRPAQEIYNRRFRAQNHHHPYAVRSRQGTPVRPRYEQPGTSDKVERALEFRREIYRKRMYSSYVGANRISRYRNITPQSFIADAQLTNRAKVFIRREFQVFDFLSPSSGACESKSDRRANNVEFLLEYIVGILKSIDLKGSTGQAAELLKDFLGDDTAKLFLHELEAWLRSPYEKLADWDRHVQYGNIVQVGSSGVSGTRG